MFDPWKLGNTPAYMKRGYSIRSTDETQQKHNTAFSAHSHNTARNFHLPPSPFPFYYFIPLFHTLSMPKIYILENCWHVGSSAPTNFGLLVFVFVWFCLVLCFCCFAVRFGFCFLLCSSEIDHGFSPCHKVRVFFQLSRGRSCRKIQRPSVLFWSVMARGKEHHCESTFWLKHSWQNLEKIDSSYKSPLMSGHRNSSAQLSCVFHVQSSSCLHVGLLQHIEQQCKQYLHQVWLLRSLYTQLSTMKQKTHNKSLVLLQVRSSVLSNQANF